MKMAAYAFICLLLLSGLNAFAQSEVKGTVKDEKGPLAGVSILLKHRPGGTQTNADGNFSIQADRGDTLVFSHSSYLEQEVVVDARANYSLTLASNAQSMENVVVIGYG